MNAMLPAFLRRAREAAPEDCVEIPLPAGGAVASLRMHTQSGRDQVANRVAETGWQSFEPPMPAIFRALASLSRSLIVDVGANTGYYALLAAASSKRGSVLAFEPDPAVTQLLERNIAANPALQRRIKTVPVALSEREGTASLYLPDPGHGLVETSASLEPGFKPVHGGTCQVPVLTLDSWLGRNARGRRVDFIKIDVEGHEASVLAGAVATVLNWRPPMFVEILPAADLGRITAMLDDWGYVTMPLRPAAPRPFQDRPTFVPDAHNHLFVPLERIGEIQALAG